MKRLSGVFAFYFYIPHYPQRQLGQLMNYPFHEDETSVSCFLKVYLLFCFENYFLKITSIEILKKFITNESSGQKHWLKYLSRLRDCHILPKVSYQGFLTNHNFAYFFFRDTQV